MVIGSSAMYSLTLIVDLALMTMNLESSFYADIITAYVKVRLRCKGVFFCRETDLYI